MVEGRDNDGFAVGELSPPLSSLQEIVKEKKLKCADGHINKLVITCNSFTLVVGVTAFEV